jgi:cyclic-di-AMP phosphodiesterase PgpH
LHESSLLITLILCEARVFSKKAKLHSSPLVEVITARRFFMIELFKRKRLQQKGLSCGKKRREREESPWRLFFQTSPFVTAILALILLAGWISLIVSRPAPGVAYSGQPIKAAVVAALIFIGGIIHFAVSQPRCFRVNSRLLLVFGLSLLQLTVVKAVLALPLDIALRLILVPFALAPLLLSVLIGQASGIFAVMFTTVAGCLLVPEDQLIKWLIFGLLCGLVGVMASRHVKKRSHFMRAGVLSSLMAFLITCFFNHIPMGSFTSWSAIDWSEIGREVLWMLGVGLATGMVVSGLIPVLEAIFRLTTRGSWMELADLNHPLLRRLAMEAPGSYHHSLAVSTIAEAAAEAIGANALLTRVCSYFHDIGKINNPEYFIENQSHDHNPHDGMAPSMSALVVIAHVKDGVDLALRHKLNREIIDVIEQHHGTSLAWYFYKRARDKRDQITALVEEDKAHETDIPEVEEANFRYPGPCPQSKESAIISLADALESASRTLEKPTPAKIEALVSEIIRSRILDGQLDECDLTMSELDDIKQSFIATLRSMRHARIAYEKDGAAKSNTATVVPKLSVVPASEGEMKKSRKTRVA